MKTKKLFLVAAMTFAGAVCMAVEPVNLVVNGGFEETTQIGGGNTNHRPTSWEFDMGTLNDTGNTSNAIMAEAGNGYTSSRTLKLNRINQTDVVSASQVINVEEETTYTFKCYAAYSGAPTNGAYSSIGIKCGDMQEIITDVPYTNEHNTGGYTDEDTEILEKITVTFDFTVPEGVTKATLTFYSGGVNKLVRIDEASIVEKVGASIESTEASMNVRIVGNQLILDRNITAVSLFNLTGANLPASIQDNVVDIANFPQGIYILRAATTDGKPLTAKFVK